MSDYKVTDTELTSIANAIRAKGETQAQLEFPSGFVSAVQSLVPVFSAQDEGKVVSNGALVAQTARASEITQNGTYDTTLNDAITVNVSSNLFLNSFQNGALGANGEIDDSSSIAPIRLRTSGFIPVQESMQYDIIFNCNGFMPYFQIRFYASNAINVSQISMNIDKWSSPSNTFRFTTPTGTHYIKFLMRKSTSDETIQVSDVISCVLTLASSV